MTSCDTAATATAGAGDPERAGEGAAVGAGTSRHRRGVRNVRVEWLRLFAIFAIATFHTLQTPFGQIVQSRGNAPQLVASGLGALASSGAALWVLGMLMLLGSWGNHVFFMISGYYLVSGAARRAGTSGFWHREYAAAARRAVKIVAAVVLYILLVLAVDHWVVPIDGVGAARWFTYDLEFVWLYLVFVLLAPLEGWLTRHLKVAGSVALAVVLMVSVMALNVYVAATIGDFRGQLPMLDWRKQMSAVTYAVSFFCAGVLGCAMRGVWNGSADADSTADRRCRWRSRAFWTAAVVVVLAVAAVLMACAAARRDYALLAKSSFKSTSPISWMLAVCALMLAMCPATRRVVRSRRAGRVDAMVRGLASGILGFYIFQALADPLVERLNTDLVVAPLAGFVGGEALGGVAVWLIAELLFSALIVLVVCLFDIVVRQPLLRLVKLA